jgi:hypothetical protein
MKREKLDDHKSVKQGSRGPLSSYDPERFPRLAKFLASRGATQAEIADCLNISVRQFKTWLVQHPALYEAVHAGNDTFTPRVERALAERAVGYYVDEYTWREVSQEQYERTGERFELIPTNRKYYPPEVTAAKFHLINRAKERWREQQNIEVQTKRETSEEILARIYDRLAKMKEQGYLTTIDIPALPAPEDDSDIED